MSFPDFMAQAKPVLAAGFTALALLAVAPAQANSDMETYDNAIWCAVAFDKAYQTAVAEGDQNARAKSDALGDRAAGVAEALVERGLVRPSHLSAGGTAITQEMPEDDRYTWVPDSFGKMPPEAQRAELLRCEQEYITQG